MQSHVPTATYAAPQTGATNPGAVGTGFADRHTAVTANQQPAATGLTAGHPTHAAHPMGNSATGHTAASPSKMGGLAQGIKGSVTQAVGTVVGSTNLKARGMEDKLEGQARREAAKAGNRQEATAGMQQAQASKAYGGPVHNTAANAKAGAEAAKFHANQ
ncbi:hypothetical protein IWQ60_011764 [Tieghemiomyces parasiticus]|uniref:Uncharacterized protein n=1 Tax=Tieghemiomyces parasiticus TaxID=78921 RepID=A0A9W7ZRC8_9FUNG|nr:hypothetical protein IWQ60_011764 [Tieghemiomyces parasiticus]